MHHTKLTLALALAAGFVAASSGAIADPGPVMRPEVFQQVKQHALEIAEQRQTFAQEQRACIEAAQDPQALRACHENGMAMRNQMRSENMSFRDGMRANRAAFAEQRRNSPAPGNNGGGQPQIGPLPPP